VLTGTGAPLLGYTSPAALAFWATSFRDNVPLVARTVANQLGVDLDQNFYVENRAGANGTIATNVVVQSTSDGYTLLYASNSIALTPFVYKNLPYDVLRDLARLRPQACFMAC